VGGAAGARSKKKRPELTDVPEPVPCLSSIQFEAPQRSHGPTGRSNSIVTSTASLNEKKRREWPTTADVLARENQVWIGWFIP
jgi:hypothetical protein